MKENKGQILTLYETNKQNREAAINRLAVIKNDNGVEVTIIKIPSLNMVCEVTGKLTQKQIAEYRAKKVQQEMQKWEDLKKGLRRSKKDIERIAELD